MGPTTLPHGSATSTTQPVQSCLAGSIGRTPRVGPRFCCHPGVGHLEPHPGRTTGRRGREVGSWRRSSPGSSSPRR